MNHRAEPLPVFLFTDFGYEGPYVGQMTAAVKAHNRGGEVINLMHDAPRMQPDLAAYLLPGVIAALPGRAVIVAVVDPGVGGPRRPVVVETEVHTCVGPDNGLLSRLPGIRRVSEILWRPARLSESFHGRDLFAPVAGALAAGEPVALRAVDTWSLLGHGWPAQVERVVYVDRYGNLMTGICAETLANGRFLRAAGRRIPHARTFSAVSPGEVFWYANSQGLVEIAANRASAAAVLSLALGDRILLD